MPCVMIAYVGRRCSSRSGGRKGAGRTTVSSMTRRIIVDRYPERVGVTVGQVSMQDPGTEECSE